MTSTQNLIASLPAEQLPTLDRESWIACRVIDCPDCITVGDPADCPTCGGERIIIAQAIPVAAAPFAAESAMLGMVP